MKCRTKSRGEGGNEMGKLRDVGVNHSSLHIRFLGLFRAACDQEKRLLEHIARTRIAIPFA